MNILFLNAYFDPESIAFTHLEHDILDELIKEGHKIKVICPVPTRGISDETAKEYSKIKYETLHNGAVQIRRFWAPQENRNPLMRAFRYFWCNFREYQIANKMVDIDVIFANSTPPTQGMLGGLVKKKMSRKTGKKIPFIFSLQDIFPDSLVNANMTKEESILWHIGRKIEDYTYENADKIITISQAFKENIVQKGAKVTKVDVVPNWVNTDNVYPVERKDNPLFDRYSLNRGNFYIVYSGNIGHSQNMDLLLQVAKELSTEEPTLRFIILGDGAAKEEVRERIISEKIENVVMLPYQDYSDIALVFSLGDVGLIISKKGIGGSSVPSKTWSIMAAERPILASFDKDSELFSVISKAKCGIAVDADDKAALKKAIIKMFHSDARKQMGRNGYQYLRSTYDKEKLVNRFVECMTMYE